MLGDGLVALARTASARVVLVAPFVKVGALTRVLNEIQSTAAVTCITRWRPEEVAAGVSDPEIWNLLKPRRGRLLLRDDLHAKFYAFDERCLVGSANLTEAALGWRERSNLEILLEVPRIEPAVVSLELELQQNVVEVDDELYQAAIEAAAGVHMEARTPEVEYRVPPLWLPRLRSPEFLYDCYSGSTADLTRAAREGAEQELAVLQMPAGMTRHTFERAVAVKLLQVPIIAGLDQLLSAPRRFGEVKDYLRRRSKRVDLDWSFEWQTLMRWLRHFLPQRYVLSVPHVSEVMIKRDALERLLASAPTK